MGNEDKMLLVSVVNVLRHTFPIQSKCQPSFPGNLISRCYEDTVLNKCL